MGEKFNPNKESSYLQYLDVNNLYGWAMSQPLPTGGFRWVSIKPNEVPDLMKCDKGYLLEVDVSYPKDLHNSLNDLPFMCERMKINGIEKIGSQPTQQEKLHNPHLSIESSPLPRIDSRVHPSSD